MPLLDRLIWTNVIRVGDRYQVKAFDPDEARDESGKWTSTGVNGHDFLLHDNGTVGFPKYTNSTPEHWDDPTKPEFIEHYAAEHHGEMVVDDSDLSNIKVGDTKAPFLWANVYEDTPGKYTIIVRRSGQDLVWTHSRASSNAGAYKAAHQAILTQQAHEIADFVQHERERQAALAHQLPVPSFGDAKDASAWLKLHWPGPLQYVGLDGISPQLLQPTLQGLMEMAVKYPDAAKTVQVIDSEDINGSTLAQTAGGTFGSNLTYNTVFFGDPARLKKEARVAKDTGWSLGNETSDTSIHEFGHVLENWLEHHHTEDYVAITHLAEQNTGRFGVPRDGIPVSNYASTNNYEWFAETFTAMQHGSDNGQVKKLREMLDRVVPPKPDSKAYDPAQTRDEEGRWTAEGGAGGLEHVSPVLHAASAERVERLLTGDKPSLDLWSTPNRIAAKVEGMRGAADVIFANPERLAAYAKTFESADEWARLSAAEQRSRVENQIKTDVSRWTHTASDTNPQALAMQRAAQVEFGTRPAGYAKLLSGEREIGGAGGRPHRGSEGPEGIAQKADQAYARYGAWNRALLRTMYERTQQRLSAYGITALKLHRGLGWYSEATPPAWVDTLPADGAQAVSPLHQPLSSWSVNAGLPDSYGGQVSLEATIPASRVIGTPYTGFGSLPEREFIVLDSPGSVQARRRAGYKAFDPNEARVPSGPGGGEFTSGGATGQLAVVAIDAAKTTKAVGAALSAAWPRWPGQAPLVTNFKDFDLGVTKESAKTLLQLAQAYPDPARGVAFVGAPVTGKALAQFTPSVRDVLDSVKKRYTWGKGVDDRDDTEYALTAYWQKFRPTDWKKPDAAILLNPNRYSDVKDLQLGHDMGVAQGWTHPQSKPLGSIVAHEFAHVVHNYIQAQASKITNEDGHLKIDVGFPPFGTDQGEFANPHWADEPMISKYAEAGEKEAFAEELSASWYGNTSASAKFTRALVDKELGAASGTLLESKAFDPSESRDEQGKWTSEGASTDKIDTGPASWQLRDLIHGPNDENASESNRARIKRETVEHLAERILASPKLADAFRHEYGENGWDEMPDWRNKRYVADALDRVVTNWGSGSTDMPAQMLQWAAVQEFGLPADDFDAYLTRVGGTFGNLQAIDYRGAQMATRRAMLRAMYDETQEQLAKAGIKNVTLYRGLGWLGNNAEGYVGGVGTGKIMVGGVPEWVKRLPLYDDATLDLKQQPLSSWSTTGKFLGDFTAARSSIPGWGLNLSTTVPASRVLSTGRSGIGTLFEDEAVLLDGPGTAMANLVKRELRVSDLATGGKAFDPDQPRDEQGRWSSGGVSTALMRPEYDEAQATRLTGEVISQGANFDYKTADSLAQAEAATRQTAQQIASRIPDDAFEVAYRDYLARTADTFGADSPRAQDTPEQRQKFKSGYVSGLVTAWQGTSVRNLTSASMQIDAQQMFGLSEASVQPAHDYIHKFRADAASERNLWMADMLARLSYIDKERPLRRAVLKAMYDETQAELAQAGITELPVTRGLTFFRSPEAGYAQIPDWLDHLSRGQPTQREMHHLPLSSWSLDPAIGRRFADTGSAWTGVGGSGKVEGALLQATVPASRIFSTGRSGLGTLSESEVVVIGGTGQALVTRTP